MDEFIVQKSTFKQVFITFLSIGFTILGAIFLTLGISESSIMPIVLGGIILLFFGFTTFHHLKLLLSGNKLVVLNKDGFYDYSSAIATKDRLVKWSEVNSIALTRMTGKLFVSIEVKNPEDVFKDQSALTKRTTRINNKMGYKDINITTQNAKGIKAQELATIMQEYFEKYGQPTREDDVYLKELNEI